MHDGDAVLSELAACTADAPFSTRPRSHVETGCEYKFYSFSPEYRRTYFYPFP